jgi:hypothetical protein
MDFKWMDIEVPLTDAMQLICMKKQTGKNEAATR